MGHYTKYVDGKLQTFTAYLYSMPLQFQFNIEIRCENMNTAFKIDQAIREFFYKNKTYHFNFRGTVVPVRVGFPESSMNLSAGATYTMGTAPTDNFIKLSMSVQAETYQPVFDPYTEMPADCSINSPAYGIWVNNTTTEKPRRTGPIKWKTDFSNMVLVSGQEIFFEWVPNYMDRDLLQVDISYKIKGNDLEYQIDSTDNHNFYHWQIPYDFTDNQKIDIMIPNTDEISVATVPNIFIYPDPKTKIVDTYNVYIKSKGFFITPEPDGTVDAIISYVDKDDNIVEQNATIHLKNFMIDPDLGIEFECFPYNNTINPLEIQIIVRDHFQKENKIVSDWISII